MRCRFLLTRHTSGHENYVFSVYPLTTGCYRRLRETQPLQRFLVRERVNRQSGVGRELQHS